MATRFSATTGCIKSWDFGRDRWQYPVIIDNMINLELLFAATRLTGDPLYYRIAVSHANNTMKNHFRKDFSCFHLVDYDTLTGKPIRKETFQGYSDSSAWARGQGWALYGYTMCYRETGDTRYLHHAERVAKFILHNPSLPKDKVPYWDFNAPAIPNEPRDASAAALIASALYELSIFSKNPAPYKRAADSIMISLGSKKYTCAAGSNNGFILAHSTGFKMRNIEVDVPLNYTDYYYLEALLRRQNWTKQNHSPAKAKL